MIKDYNTTGGFLLCHLFYMLSMMTSSYYIYARLHLYKINICTNSTIKGMPVFAISCHLCTMLLVEDVSPMKCVYVDVM